MRPTNLFSLLAICMLCSGCAAFIDGFAAFWDRNDASGTPSRNEATYGVEDNVRGTVDIIKMSGDVSRISSRAIRLPSNPMRTLTAFEYEFPDDCGGHRFRVYEADGLQILEYAYAPVLKRKKYIIRDYISGPNPFIRAGLWTAYDHTGDSVSDMSLNFARRGSGILVGTYSQGPVTDLDSTAKRVLGDAYDRALKDSDGCRG